MNSNKCEYYVNNWLLDLPSGVIIHQKTGEKKRLGEYQLKLLDVLQQHAGQILSRDELTSLVWENRVIGNNSLPNAIHALRAALEDDGKQQRIIKTIPKKGYILDADYCERVQQGESEPQESPSPVETFTEAEAPQNGLDKGETVQVHHAPTLFDTGTLSGQQPETVSRLQVWLRRRSFVCMILLLLAVAGWILTLWMKSAVEETNIRVNELQSNVHSNIRLFQAVSATRSISHEDNLYEALRDTLYLINQNLQTRQVQMNMYYHLSNITLNYTMLFNTQCGEQQLVMTIYHWRLSMQQLNSLIYRETERKLNEMIVCDQDVTDSAQRRAGVQLGFYDFLSQKKEIYDIGLENRNETLILQVTSPDDSSFLAKGRLIKVGGSSQHVSFQYRSVFYSNPEDNRIIRGVLDYFRHNTIELTLKAVDGHDLIMTQTGMLLLHTPAMALR